MDDLISRQAAIDALDAIFPVDPTKSEYAQGIACGAALAKTYVGQLPSSQPEIIRCKDCKNLDTTWQNDWAKNYHYCPLIDGTRNGDWYCADAERRTE